VNNLKTINDTYGHEMGDKVLIRLVQILKKHFRSDDYVCRIGGDEFVVFMVHSSGSQHDLISSKIASINKELASHENGLPPTSISAGIVHGSEASDVENLFEKADETMYRSKQNGKQTYTFYSG
jgi:diguanylate cyclase (GGDEF)-like protein